MTAPGCITLAAVPSEEALVATKMVSVRLDEELLRRMDRARGVAGRSAFISAALEAVVDGGIEVKPKAEPRLQTARQLLDSGYITPSLRNFWPKEGGRS